MRYCEKNGLVRNFNLILSLIGRKIKVLGALIWEGIMLSLKSDANDKGTKVVMDKNE